MLEARISRLSIRSVAKNNFFLYADESRLTQINADVSQDFLTFARSLFGDSKGIQYLAYCKNRLLKF